ncbi:hypothetical protein K438DRAFT_1759786 [Mycena galopus ATCC 62051]|nr:hypothetical protein K438DRAFT_1759786 [Mycena galopus ATCC 62051]
MPGVTIEPMARRRNTEPARICVQIEDSVIVNYSNKKHFKTETVGALVGAVMGVWWDTWIGRGVLWAFIGLALEFRYAYTYCLWTRKDWRPIVCSRSCAWLRKAIGTSAESVFGLFGIGYATVTLLNFEITALFGRLGPHGANRVQHNSALHGCVLFRFDLFRGWRKSLSSSCPAALRLRGFAVLWFPTLPAENSGARRCERGQWDTGPARRWRRFNPRVGERGGA